MGKIAVLDDNMINMIAAGEVIERPASVVKELLENSIDAGATAITVLVEDGGRKRIVVTDNGCGMDADDLQLALEPHATSKVRTADDLHLISTMGFRGEAMASIASVAQLTLISRTAESIQANVLSCDCGQKEPLRPASANVGTTVDVRNLFYKLPARRKFLRTANTEMTHIIEHFIRIALANLSLDLTLIHNTRQTYRLPAGQTLTERVGILFGQEMAETLMPIRKQEKGMEIAGLIGKPAAARTSNAYQYVFLNRRFIRDKFIQHAVRQAYQGLMEPNRYPVVFLFLQTPPEAFDVNVHPTKVEVRFDNPNLVHSQVLAALRDKLLSTNLDVVGQLPAGEPMPPLPETDLQRESQRRQRVLDAVEDFFKKPSSSQTQRSFNFKASERQASYDPSVPMSVSQLRMPELPNYPELPQRAAGQRYLQVHNSYLLLQNEQGFEIIDQHALHERILFEKLCEKIRQGKLISQRLLTPEVVQVTPAQEQILEHHTELFEQLGIEISSFGPGAIAIQSFPQMLGKAEPAGFVRDILDVVAAGENSNQPDLLLKNILERAACTAAVKAGYPLTDAEVAQLLSDRQVYPEACRCPHGRPSVIAFTLADLEKQFKRTGF
jgi:DNA mismatch repair protein MutL